MRREDLIRGLERVRSALTESNALSAIMSLNRAPQSDRESALPLEVLRASMEGYSMFSIAYERFGINEKRILKEFELDSLVDSSSWMMRTRASPAEVSLAGRGRQALETFPKFSNLVQREAATSVIVVSGSDKKGPQSLPTRKVTFIIRETEAPTLTLKDLSSVISDIEAIFQVILKINGDPSSDLIVAAFDSGSDKSLDLIGAAATVEKLSAFLLEAWDRIRFARMTKLRASIKAASDGLTLLNELQAAQDKGTVTSEEAEKLKRVLLKSVDDLFLKGVYTTEMEQSVPLQPSAIKFQRTKLITHYVEPSTQPQSDLPTEEADEDDQQ